MFAKLVFAESFCVPGGTPYLAAPSRIHWVTPFLDAKLNALMVTQCYYIEDYQSPILEAIRGAAILRSIIDPPAPRLNVISLPRFNTIRSFLATISSTKIPLLSRRASPHSGDLLLKTPAVRDRLLAFLRLSSRRKIWVSTCYHLVWSLALHHYIIDEQHDSLTNCRAGNYHMDRPMLFFITCYQVSSRFIDVR